MDRQSSGFVLGRIPVFWFGLADWLFCQGKEIYMSCNLGDFDLTGNILITSQSFLRKCDYDSVYIYVPIYLGIFL